MTSKYCTGERGSGGILKFANRRIIASILWLMAVALAFIGSSWRMHTIYHRSNELLQTRVEQIAEQLSTLFTIPGWNLDSVVASEVVFTTMRDPEIYAIRVLKGDMLLEGQRRGPQGELEPWDGESIEKSVQATSPIIVGNTKIGTVIVLLRKEPAIAFVEENSVQEMIRFGSSFFFATFCFILFLISCGDLPHVKDFFVDSVRKILSKIRTVCGRKTQTGEGENAEKQISVDLAADPLLPGLDRRSSIVISQLFLYAFKTAPEVMLRFIADRNAEGLVHLASLIEKSAPCIGAFDLQKKAARVQDAIISSPEEVFCLEVEACVQSLEQVLRELRETRGQ